MSFSTGLLDVRMLGPLCIAAALLSPCGAARGEIGETPMHPAPGRASWKPEPIMKRTDGYRGIWYYNQIIPDSEYVYKYSGGLGTYCAKHIPLAVYSKEANKTFFVWGGARRGKRELLHCISYYDHETNEVPRPFVILDKGTRDAHDNPVLMIDGDGHLWVFSSSHGTGRPSFLWRSKKPYRIDAWEQVDRTNFSYPQPWWQDGRGVLFLHTRYEGRGRSLFWMRSEDGRKWSQPQRLARIARGHYQVSRSNGRKVGTAFNYHPSPKGLNYRTNVYYLETDDFGRTWKNVRGEVIETPLQDVKNPALVREYESEGRKVYMKDLALDAAGNPAILVVVSKGYEPGPENGPRTWTVLRWNGSEWTASPVTASDNNYDTGALYTEDDGTWRIIAPTETGPQPFNPGGEMAMWVSEDQGESWRLVKQLTRESPYNHTYARKPVNAHPDFYAFWADGHARQVSPSRLYFATRSGEVYRLPWDMEGEFARPEKVTPGEHGSE